MSLFQDIRGALQLQAATAAAFPPSDQQSYEGITFKPTNGTPWARMTLLPTMGRPFDVAGDTRADRGLFQIDIYQPTNGGQGTAAADQAADAVIAVFKTGTRLFQGSTEVKIMYAERAMVTEQEADFLCAPVTVGWQAFNPAP